MSSRSTQANDILMTGRVRTPDSLEMTDYFVLFSLFLVLGWSIDPMRWQLESVPGLKRFPQIMLGINFAFIFLGKALFQFKTPRVSGTQTLLEHRWLVLFAVFVVAGSLFAKYKNQIDETFLTLGLFTLTAPLMHWYTLNARAPWKLLKAILGVFIFWSLVTLAVQFYFFRRIEIFHAREHIVLPIAGAMFYYHPNRMARVFGVLLVITAAIAVSKITAFIVGTMTLIYLFGVSLFTRLHRQKDGLVKTFVVVGFISAVILSIAAVVVAYFTAGQAAPSGNIGYRAHTYEMAWKKFLASPVWGNGFTKEAVIDFDLFTVETNTQRLPTHSDPLDILAAGGLIGGMLWLASLWPKVVRAFREVTLRRGSLPWDQFMVHQSMMMMVVGGVVVAAFNPILNIPNTAIAFWLALGCLATTTQLGLQTLSEQRRS
jgi:hypothetical protein